MAAVAAQPSKPTRRPQDYLKLPAPADSGQLRSYTPGELAAAGTAFREGAGSDALFALGSKVVAADLSGRRDDPFVRTLITRHFAGRDIAFHMCMMLQV